MVPNPFAGNWQIAGPFLAWRGGGKCGECGNCPEMVIWLVAHTSRVQFLAVVDQEKVLVKFDSLQEQNPKLQANFSSPQWAPSGVTVGEGGQAAAIGRGWTDQEVGSGRSDQTAPSMVRESTIPAQTRA